MFALRSDDDELEFYLGGSKELGEEREDEDKVDGLDEGDEIEGSEVEIGHPNGTEVGSFAGGGSSYFARALCLG